MPRKNCPFNHCTCCSGSEETDCKMTVANMSNEEFERDRRNNVDSSPKSSDDWMWDDDTTYDPLKNPYR